jgi:hypothetical protein
LELDRKAIRSSAFAQIRIGPFTTEQRRSHAAAHLPEKKQLIAKMDENLSGLMFGNNQPRLILDRQYNN